MLDDLLKPGRKKEKEVAEDGRKKKKQSYRL